jgi:hypothetical protein
MASSYSTDLKLELMTTGENSGTWGDKTNTNLNLLQQAIAGYQAIALTSTNTTLAMTNATISDARNAVIKFTGTLSANTTVFVDTGIEKTYIIENGTSGAFTLALNQVGGNSVIFGATDKTSKIVYLDGTNANDLGVVNLTAPQTLTNKTLTTPTLTSPIIDVIDDSNGNEEIKFTTTTSAVNELTVANAATGNAPEISATGDDTNIDIKITPKGTGKVVLDGIKYPNSDGSVGQVLSTDGSGNLSFTTISSSPEQLVKSVPLAVNASVSAGKLVSIGSTGVVVNLPTLNTFQTTYTNTFTSTYTATGLDGSTVIYSDYVTNTGPSKTVRFLGKLISNTAIPINGTIQTTQNIVSSQSVALNNFANVLYPQTSNTYISYLAGAYGGNNGDCTPYARGNLGKVVQINVSTTTGNTVLGPSLTVFSGLTGSDPGTPNPVSANNFDKISSNLYYLRFQDTVTNITSFVTIAGSTCTLTSDNDASAFQGANGINSILTTNNIIGFGTAATWKTAAYTASPAGIGTVTTTTQVSDYNSNGSWGKMSPYLTDSAPYIITTYQNTSAVNRYITYSVNSTTGALTAVSSGLYTDLNSMAAGSLVFADNNNAVGPTGSLAFTNGVLNSPGLNVPYTLGSTIRANTTNLYYSFGTSFLGFPTNQGYLVNAFATDSFNYLGVAKTNDSTSPVDVVTDGVAGGFTGLTAGTVYYSGSPVDGNVTTTATGVLIGKAISATEILLQRSNAQ